jgi:hypothetical protein
MSLNFAVLTEKNSRAACTDARTLANKSNGKIQAVCAGWDDESPTGAQTHHR